MKVALIVIACIILTAALVFGLGYSGVFYTKTVGKAQQNAEREVFKNSQSYNDGMAQELSKLKTEYEQDTCQIDKNAIANKIRQDFADFDESNLQSQNLKTWLIQIRGF
jgi:Tfp pilus assembly protein PilO